MVKKILDESVKFGNDKQDVATLIAHWVYPTSDRFDCDLDRLDTIEDFMNITFKPACTAGRFRFRQLLCDTFTLEELIKIKDKFVKEQGVSKIVKEINEGVMNNVATREDMIDKIIETYLYETEDDMYNNNINQEGYETIAEAFKVCLCVDLETLDDLGDWDITEGFFQPITNEGIKKVYQYLIRNYPM